MKSILIVLLSFFIVGLVLGPGTSKASLATAKKDMIWTQWDADHYTLVDDGDTIWVGSGSGLIKWDKASGTYTRISTVEGLPHRRVFSGAVDGEGNLWFGGDAGLSKLAKSGEWTHYNKSNSGIFSDSVNGIAVTANGSVWLSDTESSYVSRLETEENWAIYPNRQTAVALAHEDIIQTLNSNKLWAAAGDEVWVGYDVFNGSSWENRQPATVYSPPILVANDSENQVWALDAWGVHMWDSAQWWEYPYWAPFAGELTTLIIDKNDGVWVGGAESDNPYAGSNPGIVRLPDKADGFSLDQLWGIPAPVIALWPAEEGMWAIGPNWLLKPNGKVHIFTDAPYYKHVHDAVVDQQGIVWINSLYYSGYGALQIFDDMGTAAMNDDQGVMLDRGSFITTLEPAPNGDMWIGWEWWFKTSHAGPPTRYHNYDKLEYEPPNSNGFIDDIFVHDARHIWFAYSIKDYQENSIANGVWSLDDRGTPADFRDDVWSTYAIDTGGENGVVAFADDKLWYGDSSGLYLYQEQVWKQLITAHVQGLVPGINGVLYVDEGWRVLIIEKDGRQSTTTFEDLIARDMARVQSTERRNQMWTVAPDGAVWYWHSRKNSELARRDELGLEIFKTPTVSDYVEVDENNQVWLAEGELWRMSPEPDFSLEIGPASWFITTSESRSGQIQVKSNEGYEGTVDLSINDLPQGVTAEIKPESLTAGETAVLTMTTKDAAISETTVTINGSSNDLIRQRSFTLAVVEQVSDSLLPVVTR